MRRDSGLLLGGGSHGSAHVLQLCRGMCSAGTVTNYLSIERKVVIDLPSRLDDLAVANVALSRNFVLGEARRL